MYLETVVPKIMGKKLRNVCDGAHFYKVAGYTRKELPFLRACVHHFLDFLNLVIAEYILSE